MVSSQSSSKLHCNRGVRKGCPLSPYIFIICIFLTNNIANNLDIKGIKIKYIEFKQTLFADDASFFTEKSQQSFETLVQTLDSFGNISGLKLNASQWRIQDLT